MALVPAIADIANEPVIAAGGISDGRGVAAAHVLEPAARIGTRFLASGESNIHPEYLSFAKSERERHDLSGRLVRCWLAQCTSSSSPNSTASGSHSTGQR